MRKLALVLTLPLAGFGAGCLDATPATTTATSPGPDMAQPAAPPAEPPGPDEKALTDGNNRFAIELYKKLITKTAGDIVTSPYSISSALAMTYAGARGETAKEMERALHFTLPPDRLHPAFAAVTRRLQPGGDQKPFTLNIANALWWQGREPFRPEFLELTRTQYDGGFREVDFARDPDGARRTINQWINDRTEKRIPELLKKPDIHRAVVLVLTNAIYFRGDWEREFPAKLTREADFESAPGTKKKLPMMQSERGKFRHHATPDYQLIELPYRGGRMSMVVLLPKKRFGLADVEKTLTADGLSTALAGLAERTGTVAIPRFKARTRFDPEMKDSLSELGMPRAFGADADFTGITPRSLWIDKVIHEAEIEVDEKGTTASAATAVIMGRSAAAGFTFRADHPFLYLLRDRETGAIVFLGRYTGKE